MALQPSSHGTLPGRLTCCSQFCAPSSLFLLLCAHNGDWPGVPCHSAQFLLKHEISTISNKITLPESHFLATPLPFPASLRNLQPELALHLSLAQNNIYIHPYSRSKHISSRETLSDFKTLFVL